MKSKAPSSTHKKAIVQMIRGGFVQGYLNPQALPQSEEAELLTRDGEFQSIRLDKVKSVYFVREFAENFEFERKTFFSRPKLDGLWVRLRFRDEDVLEGIVRNDLLDIAENGIRLTPPDLSGNILWIFIPRSALQEIKVLGVVGVARRAPSRAASAASLQSKLFEE
jgi:Family of unknown function (DUF6982)